MKKPTTAAGYEPAFTSAVRATCLYVATKLGDLADDTVVVGGLVPSLIIDAPSDAVQSVRACLGDRYAGVRDPIMHASGVPTSATPMACRSRVGLSPLG